MLIFCSCFVQNHVRGEEWGKEVTGLFITAVKAVLTQMLYHAYPTPPLKFLQSPYR